MAPLEETIARLRARLLAPTQAPAPAYSDFDLLPQLRPPGPLGRKDASVLVPLIARPEGLSVLLTRRTADMPTHAGQIAFPGGRRQAEDPDAVATALREAQEEVGLAPERVEVLGLVEAYETVTEYRVTPVVGLVRDPGPLAPDPREVAAIFEAPFAFLMDPANLQRHEREWQGMQRAYYAIPYQEHYIWGATAGMLRALALKIAAQGEAA